jgi:ribosomal protein L16/L10AE
MLTPRVVKPLYKKTRKALKSFLRPYRVSTQFSYNEYAIKCADNIMLTLKNMNNLFAQLKKFVRKTGKVYIKPTTIIPITKKASETRMGSGVGKIDH